MGGLGRVPSRTSVLEHEHRIADVNDVYNRGTRYDTELDPT
ncbi:MAG: hypothetical protein ACLQCU_05805 [Acidimicrobiales bacterium]